MGKLTIVVYIIVAFVLGVYVGGLPIMSLILGDNSATSQTTLTGKVSSAPVADTGGTVIKTTNLSTGQQKLLSALGVDATEIVITPAMVVCAEAKVGSARLEEIENGAAPSLAEGVLLLACYKGS